MKKMLFTVALAFFATHAIAQKSLKSEKKAPVERVASPQTKDAGKQSGPAELDANLTKNFGALHHHLPKGSFIKVRNPKNEKVVMVEVEGNIKDRSAMYIIKISPAAAAKIDAVGKTFPVEIEYDGKDAPPIEKPENPTENPIETPVTGEAQTHTVKSGDTLSQLAKTYGVSVGEIKRANGLKGDKIKIGQKLKIPAPKPKKEGTKTKTKGKTK